MKIKIVVTFCRLHLNFEENIFTFHVLERLSIKKISSTTQMIKTLDFEVLNNPYMRTLWKNPQHYALTLGPKMKTRM